MTRSLLFTSVVAFLALGCAEGPEGTDPDPSPTVDPTDGDDIVDIAAGDPSFSTLVDAIGAAGLEDLLRSDGEFTVFAPTNDAFDALGVDLDTLSVDELTEILTYHVIAGAEVDSGSIPAIADSAASYTLFFDTSNGVRVNDATVTAADIEATNGIIHVVDAVLLPPSILDAAGYAGLSGLADAVGAADPAVAETLAGPGPFTVFAPSNDGFDAVAGVTATLSPAELAGVLTYHVVSGEVASDAVPASASTLSANAFGQPLTALFDTTDGVLVNGVPVVTADIRTTNGIVHVIEDVLLPPTVVDLASIAGLTGLLDTVGAASGDLGTVLASEGPFTVFAPSNEAFEAIAPVAATLTEDDLRDILLFHVVGGDAPVTSGNLANGEVPTLNGETVTVDLSGGVFVQDAEVISADIHGTNGVVHVIDQVMLPSAYN